MGKRLKGLIIAAACFSLLSIASGSQAAAKPAAPSTEAHSENHRFILARAGNPVPGVISDQRD